MLVKIQKVHVARVWVLGNRVEDATLQQFFLINLYLFDLIFSGIVWIDKWHNCWEGIYLLNNSCCRNRKRALFQLSIATVANRGKYFIKYINLRQSYTYILYHY